MGNCKYAGSGAVTFKNLETNETFNANLYKTDKAGIPIKP